MRRERLQNKVSGSVFTLPVCAVVAALLWWFPAGEYRLDYVIGMGLTILVAYILLETNNRNLLVRVRTRMVSSTWVIGAGVVGSMHPWHEGMVAALAMAASLFFLFRTFERRQPVVDTFHATLFLGIASWFVPWLVGSLPFYLWHQGIFLRSLSWRCFFASLIGCALPFLLLSAWIMVIDDYGMMLQWYNQFLNLVPIAPDNYLSLDPLLVAPWVFFTLLSLLGGIHFLVTSYNDRISVRMMLYIILIQWFLLQVFVTLQPQYILLILPIMLMCGSPFIAHFFALTSSWFTNLLFLLSILGLLALAVTTMSPNGFSNLSFDFLQQW